MNKPTITIGWILPSHSPERLNNIFAETSQNIMQQLKVQLPEFEWCFEMEELHLYPGVGKLKTVPLLELGLTEKQVNRWDFAFVLVPNDLEPVRNIITVGVPSSTLGIAVLSSARLGMDEHLPQRLTSLALHLFGWLCHLDRSPHGPMQSIDLHTMHDWDHDYPEEQSDDAREQLYKVVQNRESQKTNQLSKFLLYARGVTSHPLDFLASIWRYQPWSIPFLLTRSLSAVVLSLLFFMASSESWEAGVQIGESRLIYGAIVAIILATFAVYYGQQLYQMGDARYSEGVRVRWHLIILSTLLVSMILLWIELRFIVTLLAQLLPLEVVAGWAKVTPAEMQQEYGWYASFMATIGILAAMLGANLESEETVKALFLFDEEV
ncbi:MAG: hypothetical protein AAF614_11120 [Chloroflexota bacterium]